MNLLPAASQLGVTAMDFRRQCLRKTVDEAAPAMQQASNKPGELAGVGQQKAHAKAPVVKFCNSNDYKAAQKIMPRCSALQVEIYTAYRLYWQDNGMSNTSPPPRA